MKPEILLIAPLLEHTMDELHHHYQVHHFYEADDKPALLAEIAPRVRAVVTDGGSGVDADVLAALPECRIVTVFGVGVDAVALDYCRQHGIKVTNTPNVLSEDVADMGVALMLAVSRNLINAHEWCKSGQWQQQGPMPLTNRMSGKRAGILGMGSIGLSLADRLKAFGMSVSYHNRRKRSDTDYRYFPSLYSMVQDIDYLIVTAPASADTHHIINQDILDALGPDGYLINIARGTLVDQQALITALSAGQLKGAGLDVFENEPEIPPALVSMPNVVLQPHAASATHETRQAMGRVVLDNLSRFYEGSELASEYYLKR